MSSHRGLLGPARSWTRSNLLILAVFTAALCWWIAIVGFNTGAGAFFLWIPVVVMAGTVVMWLYIKPWKVIRS